MKEVSIWWEGPFSLEDIKNKTKINDSDTDYGIYQIYGTHPVYGSDVLLYIGKAVKQTLADRINQEKHWWYNQNSSKVEIYAGRLIGKTPTENEWDLMIGEAEQLLIYAHRPAHNSSNINSVKEENLSKLHILNWGDHKNLLPEISSNRIFDETKDRIEEYFNLNDCC